MGAAADDDDGNEEEDDDSSIDYDVKEEQTVLLSSILECSVHWPMSGAAFDRCVQ